MKKIIEQNPKALFEYTNIKVDQIKKDLDECAASSFLWMHIEMYQEIIYHLLEENDLLLNNRKV